MRALSVLVLAVLAFMAGPAQAVVLGTPSRDPNGLRRSVVWVENSAGELCSGAVVGPDLVLTAAHCVTDRATYRVVAANRTFKPQRFRVTVIAMHPSFVRGTTPRTQPGVDLALLKVDRPFGPDYLALDPRQAGSVGLGSSVVIAGFGVLSERQRRTARTLREASLISLGPVQVANRVLIIADRARLAETAGAGACRGDSGGPILTANGGVYRLFGIVSWSSGALRPRDLSACGGLTAVTPVAEHIDWINASIRMLSAPNGAWARR
ncbi:S1 family peptidase [Microvirga roseola]|uniref:S1 family peptidase n=1 Tax=Microvirga roseola TaxID=2883126 RepID=UPI001E539C0E|nr:trypsin-like serine protease [Microvirga roseola]